MNTYRKTSKIVSIWLLIVFIFAASQPVHCYSIYGGGHATYQNHFESLVTPAFSDWQSGFLSPPFGTLWFAFVQVNFTSEALYISIKEFSYLFLTPTINAP